jgi:toxin ParE1/3/4
MQGPRLKLIWSPEAEADLLAIWRWGATRFSPNTADTHLRDIYEAAHSLTESPFLGPSRDDLRPGIRARVVFPTVIFYRVGAHSIDIVRIVDGRRNLAAIFPSDDTEDGVFKRAA